MSVEAQRLPPLRDHLLAILQTGPSTTEDLSAKTGAGPFTILAQLSALRNARRVLLYRNTWVHVRSRSGLRLDETAPKGIRGALQSVDPSEGPELHDCLLACFASKLAKSATSEVLTQARRDLGEIRVKYFRKRAARSTYSMARLDWLEGSLYWATAKSNRFRGRTMVQRGRDLLTELRLPLEAACCTVDAQMMWRARDRGLARADLMAWHQKAGSLLSPEIDEGIHSVLRAINQPGYFAWKSVVLETAKKVRASFGELGSVLPSFVTYERG